MPADRRASPPATRTEGGFLLPAGAVDQGNVDAGAARPLARASTRCAGHQTAWRGVPGRSLPRGGAMPAQRKADRSGARLPCATPTTAPGPAPGVPHGRSLSSTGGRGRRPTQARRSVPQGRGLLRRLLRPPRTRHRGRVRHPPARPRPVRRSPQAPARPQAPGRVRPPSLPERPIRAGRGDRRRAA